jgi:hypothetical protein
METGTFQRRTWNGELLLLRRPEGDQQDVRRRRLELCEDPA